MMDFEKHFKKRWLEINKRRKYWSEIRRKTYKKYKVKIEPLETTDDI